MSARILILMIQLGVQDLRVVFSTDPCSILGPVWVARFRAFVLLLSPRNLRRAGSGLWLCLDEGQSVHFLRR
ncbi:hypothetical protein T484DRAFT_3013551 [Baffinella frigidus]|nr:hypothetical protein T484DRAFT_3013551 [Cryptophyta sp. CCMP2293]